MFGTVVTLSIRDRRLTGKVGVGRLLMRRIPNQHSGGEQMRANLRSIRRAPNLKACMKRAELKNTETTTDNNARMNACRDKNMEPANYIVTT